MGISALWGARLNDDDGYQLERGVIRMFWYDHDIGWWGYAGMGVGMVLFWALIVAGIVGLVMFVSGDRRTSQPPPSPQQILAARFARGEISETEYRDRVAVLCDPARP